MKLTRLVLALSLITFSLPALAADPAPTAAEGAKLPPAVVAVVDVQKILQDSTAAKSVREQLAARREVYQKQVSADEQKLRAAEQDLAKQRTTLTQEQFTQKRHDFEEKVRQVQQGVQDRARVLDTAFNEALGTIRTNLGQVVAEAASERGATLVLDRGQVIVVESSFDITPVVLDRLNKKLPKVAVNLPAAGNSSSASR